MQSPFLFLGERNYVYMAIGTKPRVISKHTRLVKIDDLPCKELLLKLPALQHFLFEEPKPRIIKIYLPTSEGINSDPVGLDSYGALGPEVRQTLPAIG